MAREVRRVPVDFDWPLEEVWPGFLMGPDVAGEQCPVCNVDGYYPDGWSREARPIARTFYRALPGADYLAGGNRLTQADVDHLVERGRLQVWRDGAWHSEPRTAEEVNAAQEGNGFFDDTLDDVDRHILIERRCAALGVDPVYCPACDGEVVVFRDAAHKEAYDTWTRTEPPVGDGWQLWETTSEGSPVSPVFDTAEGLAGWVVANRGRHEEPISFEGVLRWIAGPVATDSDGRRVDVAGI
ncbi:MAG: hypothetical protein OEV62_00085 [Actinomycetota bacterium]|nr:hypothetical protein [Actinomycetota bacterium]